MKQKPGAATIGLICLFLSGLVGLSIGPSGAEQKMALLIGCTEYPELRRLYRDRPQLYEQIRLYGPAQDVGLFRRALIDRLGFDAGAIQTLVGWDESDPLSRPTRTNILASLRRLENEARPGARVVVLFAGHGSQQPAAASGEEDGLDEIFLPADAGFWSETGGVVNALVDDEIGEWLERMTAKGALVWIVFDSCNSGSMTRAGNAPWARARALSPALLGIPAPIGSSSGRRGAGLRSESPVSLKSGSRQAVAFFAAQSFEQTFEIPLPEGAAPTVENYHGVLSYFLAEALTLRPAPPTYRELILHVQTRENAVLPHGPQPHGEGDLDGAVLGLDGPLKALPFHLEKTEQGLILRAGSLAGLTLDSVLAVRDQSADLETEPVGYVKIVDLTTTQSSVEIVGYAGKMAADEELLPASGVCAVVYQPLGDLRIPIAVRAQADREDTARRLAEQLTSAAASTIRLVEEAEADWVIVSGERQTRLIEKSADPKRPAALSSGVEIPLGTTASERDLATEVSRQLSKIFKWRNLLRVAGSAQFAPNSQRPTRLEASLAKCRSADCLQVDPLESGAALRAGEIVRLTLVNRTSQAQDVTALGLDSAFAVQALYPLGGRNNRLSPGAEIQIRLRVSASPLGRDWILVVSVPARGPTPVDFAWLAQQGLAERRRSSGSALERLLQTAAFGNSSTRGAPVSLRTDADADLALLNWQSRPPVLNRPAVRRILDSELSAPPHQSLVHAVESALPKTWPSSVPKSWALPGPPFQRSRQLDFAGSKIALLGSRAGETLWFDLNAKEPDYSNFQAAFFLHNGGRTACYDGDGDGVFDIILLDVDGDERADQLHQVGADGTWISWPDVNMDWIDGRYLNERGPRLMELLLEIR